MRERARELLPALSGLILFIVALEVLRHELRAVSWPTLTEDILSTPHRRLTSAVVLTVLNYAVLTGYDFLAFAYIGKRVAPLRIAVASFVAYAIANNVGFAMLSGASVRYRFYTRWGVTADELSRIVFSYNPFWEPHYLAYPGGLKLPRILADVSALVAGGYRRIFLR